MLDDDDIDVLAMVEVMHNENGDAIGETAGEVIRPAEKVSHAKDGADVKLVGQGKKPNPPADALQEDTE